MKRFFLLIAGAAVISGSAFSAQISFNHVTAQSAVPFTDNFTLQKFDPTLGILSGVVIDFAGSTTAEVDIFNSTSSTKAFTNATASIPLIINAPTGPANIVATAGPFAGNALSGFNAFPGITGPSIGQIIIAPANFGAYTGVGGSTASFSVVGNNGVYGGSSVPGVFFSGSAVSGGTTTITYTFSEPSTGTPEPATLTLFGSAALFLGALKFRNRKA